MEVETETPPHFMYPYFELCNFYAAKHITERLTGLIDLIDSIHLID